MQVDKLLSHIEKSEKKLIDRLIEFLRIPSISTEKTYASACRDAANWLTKELSTVGFKSKTYQTSGHPIVLATAGNGSPHLLFYGHYDVQPIDPLDSWDRPPFEPIVKNCPDGKIISARGASDDKGQLLTFINACEAFFKLSGSFPCKITILIEGEEESGSPSLPDFINNNKEALKADYALICDTAMWNPSTPAISTMLRGIISDEIILSAANKDLHSGMYGGPAINPIKELAKLITSLHDIDGRIKIKNFYKDVPFSPKTKKQWDSLGFSSKKFLSAVGLGTPAGETGFSALEQIWVRPTCELNGIWGGYTGEGVKTVIPAKAYAKVSFRLVGNQKPDEIRQEFRNHLRSQLHPDCSLSFISKDKGAKAINISEESILVKKAHDALQDEWRASPVYVGCGGSIPIVSLLKDCLNLDTLLVGFALDDDNIHSPNEKYSITSYIKGAKSWVRIISSLAN